MLSARLEKMEPSRRGVGLGHGGALRRGEEEKNGAKLRCQQNLRVICRRKWRSGPWISRHTSVTKIAMGVNYIKFNR